MISVDCLVYEGHSAAIATTRSFFCFVMMEVVVWFVEDVFSLFCRFVAFPVVVHFEGISIVVGAIAFPSPT